MPILDLYTRDNQKALEAQAELGRREIPKEVGIFDGVLSATGKGLGAAALETGRALTYAAGITPSGAIYKGLRDGEAPSLDKWFDESEYGKKLGETVKGLQPDPQTTGKAASIMFEVARMGGKAVGHVMTAGPAAPLTFGLDEGATETFKLTDQGVDAGTAIAAGAVHGAASAVGMALPAAGKTLKAPEASLLGLLEILFGVAWTWLGSSESPTPAVISAVSRATATVPMPSMRPTGTTRTTSSGTSLGPRPPGCCTSPPRTSTPTALPSSVMLNRVPRFTPAMASSSRRIFDSGVD